MAATFHNPYQFVPRPDRKHVLEDPDLGDGRLKPHSRFVQDAWSGTLRIRLTTETPLLAIDAQRAREVAKDHFAYPVRVDANGFPYIAPTSLKGALSAAYEAITCSRYRVLDRHDKPLGYRSPARSALSLVPARVEARGDGRLQVRLLPGDCLIDDENARYAARVESYEEHSAQRKNTFAHFRHGDEVWAVLRGDKVEQMWSASEGSRRPGAIRGWLWKIGKTIDGKKHERFFYHTGTPILCDLTDSVKKRYETLIEDYQRQHEKEIAQGAKRPSTLRYAEWGIHITDKSMRTLKDGDLCWAEVSSAENGYSIEALYPVTISRRLYEKAPIELIPDSLKPARDVKELSPADRLFGWANQDGSGAYRGKIRIGRVRCLTEPPEAAIEKFPGNGVPLNILGQPKPAQERFYVAKNASGAPLDKGAKKGEGYTEGHGLRGAKFYPHHRGLLPGYWENPTEDRTRKTDSGGWAQEYLRPNLVRDNQNRSVLSWIRPGTEFEADIQVQNLTDFELGALLWLFTMGEGHYFRLGGAKPLGFGSVRVDLVMNETSVMKTEGWVEHWRALGGESTEPWSLSQPKVDELKGAFEQKVRSKFPQILDAFLVCSKGFGDRQPVHYPRAARGDRISEIHLAQNPEGENFKWFVANERKDHQYPLPFAVSDRGLLYLPEKSPQQGQKKNPKKSGGPNNYGRRK